jgi:uncharacterized protein
MHRESSGDLLRWQSGWLNSWLIFGFNNEYPFIGTAEMMSFLYDSGWLGQLLAPTAPPEDMLYDACYAGDLSAVHKLLEDGVSPNCCNGAGNRPIHAAAIRGDLELLAALEAAGADVNSRGSEGNTALHLAACGGNVKVAEHLLQAGADSSIRNTAGFTPLGAVLELAQMEEEHQELDMASLPEQVKEMVRVLRDTAPTRAAPISSRTAPEAARAAEAILRGGDVAHLPPPPLAMDVVADQLLREALELGSRPVPDVPPPTTKVEKKPPVATGASPTSARPPGSRPSHIL